MGTCRQYGISKEVWNKLMPFAGYTDFDDCVRRNADKRDPEAYCAAVMRKTEKKGHKLLRKGGKEK